MLPQIFLKTQENREPIAHGFLNSYLMVPDNNAIFINDRYFTYKELMDIVYESYFQLLKQGESFQRVGVYCSDNVYTVASILAISLYGAAYVPLNPKFPVSRNQFIAQEANLQVILYSVQDECIKTFTDKILIDVSETEKINYDDSVLLKLRKVEQPTAYILFTSGSTGQPKGVPVSNVNVNHYFSVMLDSGIFHFEKDDKFLQMYDLTFDASVRWLFIPLIVGGCICVLPQKGIHYMNMVKLLSSQNITVAMMVPSVLFYLKSYFHEISFPQLRYSFFGGESLPQDLVLAWSKCVPNAIIENFYGPTEATMSCTRYRWDKRQSANEAVNGVVPIGILNPGMNAVVLDEFLLPVEKGSVGEFCVYGPQVVNGYLNNKYPHSFIEITNEKGEKVNCYRTGDMVRMNENGNYLFLGRKDNQVKIDGFRIELQEIENCIRNYTDGLLSIATVNQNSNGTKSIYVFVENYKGDTTELYNYLKKTLPYYLIPKKIIGIEKMPFNQNGKIDRQALTLI